jgi:hypothetical protein
MALQPLERLALPAVACACSTMHVYRHVRCCAKWTEHASTRVVLKGRSRSVCDGPDPCGGECLCALDAGLLSCRLGWGGICMTSASYAPHSMRTTNRSAQQSLTVYHVHARSTAASLPGNEDGVPCGSSHEAKEPTCSKTCAAPRIASTVPSCQPAVCKKPKASAASGPNGSSQVHIVSFV